MDSPYRFLVTNGEVQDIQGSSATLPQSPSAPFLRVIEIARSTILKLLLLPTARHVRLPAAAQHHLLASIAEILHRLREHVLGATHDVLTELLQLHLSTGATSTLGPYATCISTETLGASLERHSPSAC